MTLVIAGLKDGMAFMVSDVMASTKTNGQQPGKEISYPTKPRTPVSGKLTIVDLVQKISEISPGLYVGCSGCAGPATRFVSFLRLELSRKPVTKELLDSAYLDYFNFHREDVHLFSSIILYQDDTRLILMPHGEIYTADVPELGKIYALGTGAPEFLNYLDRSPPKERMSGSNLPENLKIISYMAEYVANTIDIQNRTGFGIPEGWGGAFELVICQENNLLKKLDNLMFIYLEWDEEDGEIRTRQIGKRYFQYYEGENLIVVSQYKGEAASIDAIFPVYSTMRAGVTNPSAHAPQMLCMLSFSKETGGIHTNLLYDQYGHDFCGVSYSEAAGHAIRFDTKTLKDMIRSFAGK